MHFTVYGWSMITLGFTLITIGFNLLTKEIKFNKYELYKEV